MKSNEFKNYHPIVNFIYFICAIGFTMFIINPLFSAISLVCAFTYSTILRGTKSIRSNLLYMIPVILLSALVTPLFSHEGITVLTYLPDGNPLTLESILYAVSTGVMLCSVICHFSCYNDVMTSDKFIYLFGKATPSLSLLLSMTLRFVPKFKDQLRQVTNARKCLGYSSQDTNVFSKAKNAISILSIMVTRSLENAADTANSMKARGYGIRKRSSFSIYTFDKRDAKALITIVGTSIYILTGIIRGEIDFSFYPYIEYAGVSAYGISVTIAFFVLCTTPIIIEIWEVARWNSLKSKI